MYIDNLKFDYYKLMLVQIIYLLLQLSRLLAIWLQMMPTFKQDVCKTFIHKVVKSTTTYPVHYTYSILLLVL